MEHAAYHLDDGSDDHMEFHDAAASSNTCTVSEIVEEDDWNEPLEARYRVPTPVDGAGDDVYIAVGKSSSSMDAVSWTLKHGVTSSSTLVYLVHVFPEVRHIPTPLGKMPRSQVSPAQVEGYLNQERDKRRVMLHKFLNLCSASKVEADTLLIESDIIEKAILDLIPVLRIRKLVVGTTKSNLRKGSGKAKYIQKNAPDFCKVKIVCEGKEVAGPVISSSCLPLDQTNNGSKVSSRSEDHEDRSRLLSCTCFSTKFI